jgi:hypothetical protein
MQPEPSVPEPKKEIVSDTVKLQDFGKRYAEAWSSQKPESVAAFFATNGSLKVNDDPPAEGREAITKVAQGFMTAFPDMAVSMDMMTMTDCGNEFHWTLTGTNTGPKGTGKKVRISGFEIWQMDSSDLIIQSIGSYNEKEYSRQLKYGVAEESSSQ